MESMATFQSNLIVTTDLLAAAPDLELAFENFLRNVRVHATIITAPRVSEKFDRWTFVCLNDAEAGKKSNDADFGVELSGGDLAHKREVSKVITAWKQAKGDDGDEIPDGSRCPCSRTTCYYAPL